MRLYYHPLSSNSRRVVMTAIHLNVRLERVVVDLLKGEHKAPEYLRLNPNGKVPLLDDDGFCLWESHAIMQYLADGSPGQDLYPRDIRARADVNRWLFWSAYHFTPAVGFISRERVSKNMVGGSGAPDMAEIGRGEALLAAAVQVLDDHLARNRWIAQDKLTLADLAIASPLMHTAAAELPVTGYENVQAWFARVQALEAWKKSAAAPSASWIGDHVGSLGTHSSAVESQ
ncbi:glutathione S-transferase family protein [Bradyrhizobium sp. KBS0727]|uniref:glutathione S-transferase family protein n=1 Tax=unclassified Bradyrhizobium TaxID=2631580 RepID=UPI00110F1703|nr:MULTISPECIES: glutathione S-transferase family protein [unclassified Bradyrhizobium]QDW39550.1 glutathione S-transferase family protein [Bradyrhizobium sp. KBS0725]QDW46153.1 glutathione S-transferase family protein [Bradyrhizobium sp. KBS0727]